MKNKKEVISHIRSLGAKSTSEIFAIPLGALNVLPEFNLRIDYDLEPLVEYINNNGVQFPPLKLQLVGDELYIDEGHRRYFACIQAGLPLDTTKLNCYVDSNVEAGVRNDAMRIANQITSNNGKKYSNIELMLVCRELSEKYNWDSKDIYTRLNISQSKFSNLKKLFGLSKKLIIAISESAINYSEIIDALRVGSTEDEIFQYIRDKIAYESSLETHEDPEDTIDDVNESTTVTPSTTDLSDTDIPKDLAHIINQSESEEDHYKPQVDKLEKTQKPKKESPKAPVAPGKKIDFKNMCERLVSYDTDQDTEYVTIKIPVEDYNTIIDDIDKSNKKRK